jgi:hypothetical protein
LEATIGKLRLVLRSKKVMARTEAFESGGVSSSSLMAWNGELFVSRRRIAVYDYVFDEKQTCALSEARDLARRSGLSLEVVDLSRQNALRRVLRLGLSMVNGEVIARFGPSSNSKTTQVEPQDKCADVISAVVRP